MKKEYLECGKVCSAHGVRGAIKVEHWCDAPRVLASQKRVFFAEKDGNSYIIEAADHNRITVPRWRLFPLGNHLPPKIKFAATIKVKNEGDAPANQPISVPAPVQPTPVQATPATIAATEVAPPQPVRRNPSRSRATHRKNLADTNPILL